MWESARLKRAGNSGYPSFSTQNKGFFTRHMRRISSSLPRFSNAQPYAEKEKDKPVRAPWSVQNLPLLGRLRGIMARMGRKMKMRLLFLFLLVMAVVLFYTTRESCYPSTARNGISQCARLTCCSFGVLLAKNDMARRRSKVRHHIGGQRRRRCHGVEGRPGVGH